MQPTPEQAKRPAACTNCAYDLTGLEKASLCPECGHEVSILEEQEASYWQIPVIVSPALLALGLLIMVPPAQAFIARMPDGLTVALLCAASAASTVVAARRWRAIPLSACCYFSLVFNGFLIVVLVVLVNLVRSVDM